MEAFTPTPEQRDVIDHRGRHALVFAGPGTGKTETLARRFASLASDDRIETTSILVLTFSRRAADTMRRRIVQRMRERSGKGIAVPELHVYTFHGFCRRLLDGDRPRGAGRDLLNPIKERLLWKHVVAEAPLRTFSSEVAQSTAFATEVLNLIARLKGDGVGPDAFALDAAGDDRLLDIAALYQRMHDLRSRLGLSDFRDLVADAVRTLDVAGSAACEWLAARGGFAHVLVDEFQDSDPMQLRLLEALGGPTLFHDRPRPEICFVGDFNQSIYRFRGADPANLAKVQERFRCKEFGLTLNRRSVQAVLDIANQTPHLQPESLTKAEPGKTASGSVRLFIAQTAEEEIGAIADSIARRVRDGTPPEAIAVLLRVVEPYRDAIARELESRGIPVAAQSATGIYDDSLVDAVRQCIRVIADPDRRRETMVRLMINPLVGFDPVSVAMDAKPPLGRISWEEFQKRLEACKAAGGPAYRFDPVALVQGIVRELDLLWPIREGRDVPGFHPAASPSRLESLIQAAHDIRDTIPKVAGQRLTPQSFLDVLEELKNFLGDQFEGPGPGIEGVAVMSIHGAKGLEFDFVVVPQCLDGVLPARLRPDPLFGDRSSSYRIRPDDARLEEASLWYVALTRARLDVLATAAQRDDDGVDQTVSPFVRPISDVVEPAEDEHDTNQASGANAVDFAAAYTAATDAERVAPAIARYLDDRPVLASYVQRGDLNAQTPIPVSWVMDRLSPSGIECYVECPRRWFYKYALQLGEDVEDATRMGRFVHQVLERYHTTDRDFTGDRTVDADAIMAALSPILSEEAVRVARESRLATDSPLFRYELARTSRQLRAYADWLVEEAAREPFTILDVERRIEIPLGDIRLVGRVDRIDRLEDGRLVVRDYKTGKLRTKEALKALDAAFGKVDAGAPGIGIFGDAPEGLRLQTLLYVRGVEAAFGCTVARADYIYLGGEKDPTTTAVDSIDIDALGRTRLDEVYDVIAGSVAREILDGDLTAFPTAVDPKTCTYCSYSTICPGAGAVEYQSAGT